MWKNKECITFYSPFETILVALIGASAAVGEQMNTYFPLSSKLFVIFSSILLLCLFLNYLSCGKRSKKTVYFARYGGWFWITFTIILIILIFRYQQNSVNSFAELIEHFKTPLFMVFSIAICSTFLHNEKNLNIILLAFLVSFVVMIPFGKMDNYISAYRFYGTYANPNTYAVDCILAIFCSIYFLSRKKFKVVKILFLLISAYALLRTGSRGALLSVVFGLFVFLVFTKDFQKKIIIILGVAFIAIAILVYSSRDSYGIINRLFEKSYSGNVRLQIWRNYLNNMVGFLWFGANLSEFVKMYDWSPHNAYLGVFVNYGIFAFCSYVLFIVSNMIKCYKIGKSNSTKNNNNVKDKILSGLIFSLFLSGMTMENIYHRTVWIMFSIILYNILSHSSLFTSRIRIRI